MSIFHGTPWVVPVGAVAGIVADLLYRRLAPNADTPRRVRLFAASLPVVLYAFYFLALAVLGGIWWPVHVWTGAIALGGVSGWLVSYLVVPIRVPVEWTEHQRTTSS